VTPARTAALALALLAGCGRSEPAAPPPAAPAPLPAPEPAPDPNKWTKVRPDGSEKPPERNPTPFGPEPKRVPSPVTSGSLVTFSGRPDGYAVVTGTGPAGHGEYVVHLDTGKSLGVVPTPKTPRCRAVSPDGKLFAYGWSDGNGSPDEVIMHTIADGASLPPFRPHFDAKTRKSELAVVRFAAAGRLLTVTTTGGFAAWRTEDRTRVVNVPGKLPPGTIDYDRFGLGMSGFDLTEDGKRLALFDGDGFTFYDPQTGEPGGKTERVAGKLAVGSAAFRADGSRLAAKFRVGDGPAAEDLVVVWDAATGKRVVEFRPKPGVFYTNGWSVQWFGPDHLVFRTSAGSFNEVWSVDNPRKVALLSSSTLRGSPGDEAWLHEGRKSLYGREPPDAPKFLIHAPPPPPLGANPVLWLSYRGFTPTQPLD